MARVLGLLLAIAALAAGAIWYYEKHSSLAPVDTRATEPAGGESWLDDLYSQNPRDAEAAERRVRELGDRALPLIQRTLRDPAVDTGRRKAATKACSVLGQKAAPLVNDVAAWLAEPEMTVEAALALSFMGRTAFNPLKDALSSDDPVERREALRSIGKLKERAGLESGAVVPLLLDGMADDEAGVRAVAATYLGILQDDPDHVVPVLVEGLRDEDVEVRRASATALGSFGSAARAAIPALRHASGDPDPDVAREAGRAVVKLQGKD